MKKRWPTAYVHEPLKHDCADYFSIFFKWSLLNGPLSMTRPTSSDVHKSCYCCDILMEFTST